VVPNLVETASDTTCNFDIAPSTAITQISRKLAFWCACSAHGAAPILQWLATAGASWPATGGRPAQVPRQNAKVRWHPTNSCSMREGSCPFGLSALGLVRLPGAPSAAKVCHPRKLREPRRQDITAGFSKLSSEYYAVTKLYVGNLPFTATEEGVRALFSKQGTVEKVSLITDRETGRPRGFGFVEMSNADASRAMQALNGADFDGRALKFNEAQDRERSGGGGGQRGGGSRRY
jgi:cold-inducible RNA-binding protein